jgi:hypothetical protein
MSDEPIELEVQDLVTKQSASEPEEPTEEEADEDD